jgi:RecA-family ATPase
MEQEPEPIDWMIDGWLAKKEILLLAGQAGGGKSTTAVDMAIALAMRNGDGWMGGKIQNCPVLYLDEEAGKDQMLRQFHRQGGKKLKNLFVATSQGLRLDDPKSIDKIEAEIKDKQPGLLILDTASHFWLGADENSAPDVTERFLPLFYFRETYGVSTLILHHLRKSSRDGTDSLYERIRGSTAFITQASTVWTQVRPKNSSYVEVNVEKRRGGRADQSFRIEYTGSDTEVTLSYGGEPEQSETETNSCEKFIKELMTSSSQEIWTTADLQYAGKKASHAKRTVTRSLSAMVSLGILQKPFRNGKPAVGLYQLPHQSTQKSLYNEPEKQHYTD